MLLRPRLQLSIPLLILIATACTGEQKERTDSSTPSPTEGVAAVPVESVAPEASKTETPAQVSAKVTGPKFVERYDPESKTFEKAVELEGGDSIGVAEWNRLWDPTDPRFKEQVGSRYSRFSTDEEYTSSGEVTVDRPNRKAGVTRVTHCSRTSGQLRRRG